MVDKISVKKIQKLSSSLKKIVYFDCIDSTNTVAKQLIREGVTEKTLIIASEQTAGRGRRNRSFYSPADSGVYFSLILTLDVPVEKTVLATTAAAVACAEAIEELSAKKALIKWINDVYVDGKKCVGILTESVYEQGKPLSIIIGIGINVSTEDFPSEIRDKAGNVGSVDKNLLVARICDKIVSLCYNDKLGKHLDEYKKRCFVLGRMVEVVGKERYFAMARGIDELGRLIVEKNGEIIYLCNEEVSVLIK